MKVFQRHWKWIHYVILFLLVTCGIALEISGYLFLKYSKGAWTLNRPGLDDFTSDWLLGWRLKPNQRIYAGSPKDPRNLFFSTDPFGFRNGPDAYSRNIRAVLLGDSFVEGYFLNQGETIGAELAKRIGGNVLNMGVGGYSTDQEYMIGHRMLKRHHIDYLVLFFFSNDLPYLASATAWDMDKPYFVKHHGRIDFSQWHTRQELPWHPFPGDSDAPKGDVHVTLAQPIGSAFFESALANEKNQLMWFVDSPEPLLTFFRYLRLTGPIYGLELENYKESGIGAYLNPSFLADEWNLAFQFFERLNRESKKAGTRFLVFYIPEISQVLARNESLFTPQRTFAMLCAFHQVDCIEPHLEYLKRQRRESLYFLDDGHFSPAGAQLAADIVADHLLRQ